MCCEAPLRLCVKISPPTQGGERVLHMSFTSRNYMGPKVFSALCDFFDFFFKICSEAKGYWLWVLHLLETTWDRRVFFSTVRLFRFFFLTRHSYICAILIEKTLSIVQILFTFWTFSGAPTWRSCLVLNICQKVYNLVSKPLAENGVFQTLLSNRGSVLSSQYYCVVCCRSNWGVHQRRSGPASLQLHLPPRERRLLRQLRHLGLHDRADGGTAAHSRHALLPHSTHTHEVQG